MIPKYYSFPNISIPSSCSFYAFNAFYAFYVFNDTNESSDFLLAHRRKKIGIPVKFN